MARVPATNGLHWPEVAPTEFEVGIEILSLNDEIATGTLVIEDLAKGTDRSIPLDELLKERG